ncbi:prepilin-type N-terminal cleavage/methylation domain-containing protein [Paenisporosarcina macmurdoensis]|uniref:Prepilin-type N-terminal cleavage/methylation domain-containing protein n=1 Tax=Paenisporosarcina macmurdoensis TaxID=212659 RepID=A0ABW1L865_9BACL
MRKFIQQKLKEQKGLTLIELLAVIVILAIIAAIAIPAIGNIINNSRVGAVKSDYINAIAASELYLLDNPNDISVSLENLQGTPDVSTDSGEVYLDDSGSLGAFAYKVEDKTVTGNGTVGNVTITTENATKEDISSLQNSADATSAGTVKLAR